MNKLIGLTKRNLLIYFKDKSAILFSMLTPIIVLVLYLIFLKGTFVDGIENAAQQVTAYLQQKDIDQLANGLLLAGILGSAMITVPYNCLMPIVSDKERKIDYDISVTPMKRVQIIISYFLAAAISAFMIASVILTIGLIVLYSQGDLYLGVTDFLRLYGTILLGSISATAFFMIFIIFFKTSSASGAFMGILSAAAGFVIGAYIPLASFSANIRTFCNLFPATGITILVRDGILHGVLHRMDQDLGGMDEGLFVENIKKYFTFRTEMSGEVWTLQYTVVYIIGIAIISLIIMAILYPKVYKRK